MTPPGTSPPRMAPGTVLADRYEVTGLVGRGGMGEVHRAHDRLLGRDVAIKVPVGAVDDAAHRRLLSEARVIAGLDHPNVVAIHDLGEHEGRPFFVMALVEGQTLDDLLGDGSLPVDRSLEIASEIAAGLHEAHRRGIVHRDVKPANVLIDHDDRARVTDFGIAAAVGDDLTSIRGSLAWTAPEQARGQVDVRSDVYSLGCVLTAMLTGAPPYVATNPAEELTQHQTGALPSLVERNPAVTPVLESVVHRMLAKDPANRPADMVEVIARLDAATGNDATQRLLPAGGTSVLPDPGPTRVLADPARVDDRSMAATRAIEEPAADPATGPLRRDGIPAPVWGVLVVLLALLVGVALAVSGDDDGSVPVAEQGTATPTGAEATASAPTGAEATASAPTTTLPTVTTPEPEQTTAPVPAPTTPATTPPADLEQAVAGVRRVLASGRADGQVSADAVEKVEEKLDKTLDALQKFREDGKEKEGEKVIDELDKLDEEVDKREGDGIASALAADLRAAAARLRLFVEGAVDEAADDEDDDRDDER